MSRTFRYLAAPRFPEGIDSTRPARSRSSTTAASTKLAPQGPPPASSFQSVQGFDAFNPETNFHDPNNANQNGVVFFPGSAPLQGHDGSGPRISWSAAWVSAATASTRTTT